VDILREHVIKLISQLRLRFTKENLIKTSVKLTADKTIKVVEPSLNKIEMITDLEHNLLCYA